MILEKLNKQKIQIIEKSELVNITGGSGSGVAFMKTETERRVGPDGKPYTVTRHLCRDYSSDVNNCYEWLNDEWWSEWY